MTPLPLDELIAGLKLAEEKRKKREGLYASKGVLKEHAKQTAQVSAGSAIGAGAGFLLREAARGRGGNASPKELSRVADLVDRKIEHLAAKHDKLTRDGLRRARDDERQQEHQSRDSGSGKPRDQRPNPRPKRLSDLLPGALRKATFGRLPLGS